MPKTRSLGTGEQRHGKSTFRDGRRFPIAEHLRDCPREFFGRSSFEEIALYRGAERQVPGSSGTRDSRSATKRTNLGPQQPKSEIRRPKGEQNPKEPTGLIELLRRLASIAHPISI